MALAKQLLLRNFAALLARKGHRVFLLDLDVYAPSLQSYFETDPKKWINDFLFENAELKEVVLDFTPLIESRSSTSNNARLKARRSAVNCGLAFAMQRRKKFSNWKEGHKLRVTYSKIQLLRRFILLRELLRL